MSYCTHCHCYFDTPGSCNCFAHGGRLAPRLSTTSGANYCGACLKPLAVPPGSSVAPCNCPRSTTISWGPSTTPFPLSSS